MTQTLSNADAALKNWYLPGIRSQLNDDIPFLQYVEKCNEKQEVDVTSGGNAITWGIQPSQFIKKENIPQQEEEEEEDSDD